MLCVSAFRADDKAAVVALITCSNMLQIKATQERGAFALSFLYLLIEISV